MRRDTDTQCRKENPKRKDRQRFREFRPKTSIQAETRFMDKMGDEKELLDQAHAESEKLVQDRAQARRQQTSRKTWR